MIFFKDDNEASGSSYELVCLVESIAVLVILSPNFVLDTLLLGTCLDDDFSERDESKRDGCIAVVFCLLRPVSFFSQGYVLWPSLRILCLRRLSTFF